MQKISPELPSNRGGDLIVCPGVFRRLFVERFPTRRSIGRQWTKKTSRGNPLRRADGERLQSAANFLTFPIIIMFGVGSLIFGEGGTPLD
jgi:hypothetical protein